MSDDEIESFNWFEEYEKNRDVYYPFSNDFPENIRCTQVFLDPANKIVKISQKNIKTVNGNIDELERNRLIPSKVTSSDAEYHRMDIFSYFINATSEVEILKDDYQWGTINSYTNNNITEIFIPRSVRALHNINTIYVIYKKSSITRKKDVKSRKKVHFGISGHNKTRRR